MAALDALLAQALELSDEERSELVDRLLQSLESGDGEDVSPDERLAAWSDEIDRRLRDLRDGRATLIDGDEAMRQIRDRIAARRR